MSALRGVATIAGVAGITITSVIVSGATDAVLTALRMVQSADHSRDADFKWIKNASGDDVAAWITDASQTFTFTVLPYEPAATSGAVSVAADSADAWMQAAGAKVTVADSDGTVIDGVYLLMSAKFNRTNDGFGLVDLEVKKWDDNDLTLVPI